MENTTPTNTENTVCVGTRPDRLVAGDIVYPGFMVLEDAKNIGHNTVRVELETGPELYPIRYTNHNGYRCDYRVDRLEMIAR